MDYTPQFSHSTANVTGGATSTIPREFRFPGLGGPTLTKGFAQEKLTQCMDCTTACILSQTLHLNPKGYEMAKLGKIK